MKARLLNLLLLLTPMIAYMEWGADQSIFLIEVEIIVLKKAFTEPESIIHFMIILPILGQLGLIANIFLKQDKKWLVLTGIVLPEFLSH